MQFSDQNTLEIALLVLGAGLAGLAVGHAVSRWVVRLDSDRPPTGVLESTTVVLLAGFVLTMVLGECQRIPYVEPDPLWRYGRIVFHSLLLCLLVAATWTDLRHTEIPDEITVPGMLLGIGLATLSGDLQLIHLWMDWNPVAEPLHGGNAVIPEWIREHHHWHGLAWSLAGLACGGGLTWLVRSVSGLVLGREALGLGDVTLMAMIGSFVGWQAVLFIFLLAPFCGLIVGLVARAITNRPYVPYGPFLATAAVLVLFGWRWIWLFPTGDQPGRWAVRNLFGDGISLAILGGTALGALCLLLGLVRLYSRIPVTSRERDDPAQNRSEPSSSIPPVDTPPVPEDDSDKTPA